MAKAKYPDAAALGKAMKAYFKQCAEDGKQPNHAGMLLYLNISQSWVDRHCDESYPNYSEYRGQFEKARLMIEDLLNQAVLDKGKTQGAIFLLKQKKNGGYKDREEKGGGETKLTINLVGLGGDAQFKG